MKRIIALLAAIAVVFSLAACKSNEEKKTNDANDIKTENSAKGTESKASEPVASTSDENADVKMDGNKIVNTVNGENGKVTVQEYVYDGDVLSDINVTMKFESEEEAKKEYESIINGELKEEYEKKYDNVELNGNYIQAEYKEEQIEPVKALAKDEMYLILNSAVTTYEIKE